MTGRDKYHFTLYHVLKTSIVKRKNLKENFLLAYDGRRAEGLDALIANGHTGKRFLDSGAYVAWRNNTDLDLDKYIDYVNLHHTQFDAIAGLDYIPRESDGTPEQRSLYSARKTWEQFEYMWYKIPVEARPKLIYVLHESEDIVPLLSKALEWRDTTGHGINYFGIGLSSSTGDKRMRYISMINDVCKKYNYTGNIHAFGLQSLDLMLATPYFTTADSSSAVRDAIQGNCFIQGKPVKIQDDTQFFHKSKLSAPHQEIVSQFYKQRALEMNIDYELAKTSPDELYLWSARERSRYIEDGVNNSQVKKQRVSNLLKKS